MVSVFVFVWRLHGTEDFSSFSNECALSRSNSGLYFYFSQSVLMLHAESVCLAFERCLDCQN